MRKTLDETVKPVEPAQPLPTDTSSQYTARDFERNTRKDLGDLTHHWVAKLDIAQDGSGNGVENAPADMDICKEM